MGQPMTEAVRIGAEQFPRGVARMGFDRVEDDHPDAPRTPGEVMNAGPGGRPERHPRGQLVRRAVASADGV